MNVEVVVDEQGVRHASNSESLNWAKAERPWPKAEEIFTDQELYELWFKEEAPF